MFGLARLGKQFGRLGKIHPDEEFTAVVVVTNRELREDGFIELREDGGYELRE